MSDFAEALNLALATGGKIAGAKVFQGPNRSFFMASPEGLNTNDVTERMATLAARPRRRKGTVKLLSLRSFADFSNRYADADGRSVIFADTQKRTLTTVFNYHEPISTDEEDIVSKTDIERIDILQATEETKAGADGETAQGEDAPDEPDELDKIFAGIPALLGSLKGAVISERPRFDGAEWADFRAVYEFPLSRQWRTWREIDGKAMSQLQLANFLEDNIRDIADPGAVTVSASMQVLIDRLRLQLGDPARLLEVSRGLEIRSSDVVRQAVNTDTGESIISFEETHQQGSGANPKVSDLRVPTGLLLAIPVFDNGSPYLLLARLRYRRDATSVKWTISIQGAEAALEDAFKTGCDAVVNGDDEDDITGTDLPLLYGVDPGPSLP